MERFLTQKGKEGCSFHGFGYRIDSMSTTTIRWRCLSFGCNGKLWTDKNYSNPQERGLHNPDHALGNWEELKVKIIKANMKKRAQSEPSKKITTIYEEARKYILGSLYLSIVKVFEANISERKMFERVINIFVFKQFQYTNSNCPRVILFTKIVIVLRVFDIFMLLLEFLYIL